MLREYFSLGITVEGMVDSLPLLIHDVTPNLDKLPLFLMRLGPQVSLTTSSARGISRCSADGMMPKVSWNSERECFDSFLRELAYFYVPGPGPLATVSSVVAEHDEDDEGIKKDKDGHPARFSSQQEASEKWQIEHVLFPAMKRYLTAPKSLLTRDVVQIASLPDLYRVFERC